MDFTSKSAIIISIFSITFMLNLYFGYLRNKSSKFSIKWFLYIHMPVPVVIIARILSNLDSLYIPLFIFAAVTGQILGGKLEF